jgi:beta-lactamase class A
MVTRRSFVVAAGAAVAGYAAHRALGEAKAAEPAADGFVAELRKLEHDSGGRLGVALLDTASGAITGQRLDERFLLCSTFKALLAGATLRRVDQGKESLSRRIVFGADKLVSFSPVTKERIGGEGMTVAELCQATITRSDNTAANLLIASLGGAGEVTGFARTLGDEITRLDRIEPELNRGGPGEERDTTTPRAMAADLRALVLGAALSPVSREQLTAWLRANATGDMRLRAGLPPGWQVGDKTGTGEAGTANDVAVIWPPGRKPVIAAAYLTQSEAAMEARNATIAAVGRAVAKAFTT